jgi:hypothetical protein
MILGNPYRKDRKLGEGGVFLAVDCTYITSEITPSTNCETVWCKVSMQGSQPLYIGTFYRQPNSDIDELEELEKMIFWPHITHVIVLTFKEIKHLSDYRTVGLSDYRSDPKKI